MKKRILLIALAAILLLGCGIGAWLYFWQPEQTDGSGWVQAQRRDIQPGALSDLGYYYIPWIGKRSLHYMDFGTGKSAVLCSRLGCDHDSKDCDAYIKQFNCKMFYYQDRLYYGNEEDPVLYSRDATGLSLMEVGTPGKQFIEQQKSVSYDNIAPLDGWMYYQASVTSEDEDSVNITEMRYIGRINLTTGKDEVLVEDAGGSTLSLHAVRTGSVLYSRWETGDLDSSDPDYSEKFRQLKVTLERYDPETDSSTVLFEKTRAECHEIHTVWDNKVYCANYPGNTEANIFVYDMDTGEYTLQYQNVLIRHLGGGYAFSKEVPDGKYKVLDLTTGELLENRYEDSTPHASVKSDKGIVLWFLGDDLEDGSNMTRYCYVPYDALADGLQETDLTEVNSMQTSPSLPQDPTTPAAPPSSDLDEMLELLPKTDLSYENLSRKPDDQIQINVQNLPETVENPQSLPVLKWVCLVEGSTQVWTEEAVHEANQMLADRNMPFRVRFIMITTDCYGTQADIFSRAVVQDALKDADLIYARMGHARQKEYLTAITDYAAGSAQPPLKNAVPHQQDWLGAATGGEIYGIPCVANQACWDAWAVNPEAMDTMGLTAGDFQKNYWEMDELFAEIYKKNGEKPFLYQDLNGKYNPTHNDLLGIRIGMPDMLHSVMPWFYQRIGMHYVIDRTGDSPKVVNALDSEIGRKIWEAAMRYQKAGYVTEISEDGIIKLTEAYTNEVYTDTFFEHVVIPYGDAVLSNMGNGSYPLIGVAAVSQKQEAAVALLQLLADDEAFRDQLCFGKEKRDYKLEKAKFGSYSAIKREDGAYYNMQFLSPYAECLSEVTKDEGNWYFYCSEGKTRLETYRENKDKVTLCHYPVSFDLTGHEAKMKAIGKILGGYCMIMNNPESYEEDGVTVPAMTPEVYDQMLQEISDAGGDEIQAELQRQLDEWLAANPDWQ